VKLSLLVRLSELVAAHRDCRDLRDQLHSRTSRPVTPGVAQLIAAVGRRALHADHAVALRAAAGVVATILIGCGFWIASGWPDGAAAMTIAGVCCGLFGSADDALRMVMKFFTGSLFGLALAVPYAFVILPRVTDFVTLAAVLAPTMLVVGTLLARPQTTLIATGFLLTMLASVGLGDHYGGDFGVFLNAGLAQLAGILLAAIMVGLFQVIGAEGSARRLARAGWRDLARECRLAGLPDGRAWIGRMLDRIGLLGARLAVVKDDPAETVLGMLVDLRVGVAIGELRRLTDPTVGPVLQGVGDHYAARRTDRLSPPPSALLACIDGALGACAGLASPATQRGGVLALTSLRRNLFPGAAPFAAAGAA
jgi:uncharacterized membrane protein YccC